ncbi:MAG TPA: LamG-like jellyroll fold domain-containing protein [Pirellulaceae bacterium]|nr:LamG-like jellyroll fold domain-containing protein [Pirellulaceae bacterium]
MKHLLFTVLYCVSATGLSWAADDLLQAGAASVNISPRTLPAIRNGGFLQAVPDHVDDHLYARCLVLADGNETVAIAIVDSCMYPTDICDAIKAEVSNRIGLPASRILISATHTHSAPSVMSFCLGTGRDEPYTGFVVPRVVEGIVAAHQNLQPAKVGWTSVNASEDTNCRRWITRSDRMGPDPFGQRTVRAMMHPGYQNPSYVSPAGPIDPQLFILSVVSAKDDTPLCIMANFSMHYFGGSSGFSADYFGEVAGLLESRIAEASGEGEPVSEFVGIMSQGTSGDLHWMNYAAPRRGIRRQQYAEGIAGKVLTAWKQIEHRSELTLAMAESRLKLWRRIPTPERLAWAAPINAARGSQPPRNRPEVYAQQARWIHENPETELVLQAVRIGDLAIAALPNEVYGITGLKLKQQSPLADTFNLELANGAEGYIPPPEQHRLGGYTTWPARTAGLEEQAEPKIVETVLSLLESVSGKPRRPHLDPQNGYSRSVLEAEPAAYWRLGDMVIDRATDASGEHHAEYKGGVALYLPGPDTSHISSGLTANRCVYFAGGYLESQLAALPNDYTVSLWFWNGLPADSRDKLGPLFTRGTVEKQESLSIVSNENSIATLVFESGSLQHPGKTPLATQAWHHVALVHTDDAVRVYLDGQADSEIEVAIAAPSGLSPRFCFAGDGGPGPTFDGKLDDIAVFGRALRAEKAVRLYRASGMKPPKRPKPPVILGEKPADARSLQRYAEVVRKSKPVAYWKLHDSDDQTAHDSVGQLRGTYELKSQPRQPGTATKNFSGGRVNVTVPGLANTYSIELWMRNELPNNSRPVTGYMFTRGVDGDDEATGDCLGIGGTHSWTGRLFVYNGDQRAGAVAGSTMLARGSWNHVVMVREGADISVYLNGDTVPEIDGQLPVTFPEGCQQLLIGGRNDNFANFQGMIDEVAVYDRVLTPDEVQAHFQSAGARPVEQPKPKK